MSWWQQDSHVTPSLDPPISAASSPYSNHGSQLYATGCVFNGAPPGSPSLRIISDNPGASGIATNRVFLNLRRHRNILPINDLGGTIIVKLNVIAVGANPMKLANIHVAGALENPLGTWGFGGYGITNHAPSGGSEVISSTGIKSWTVPITRPGWWVQSPKTSPGHELYLVLAFVPVNTAVRSTFTFQFNQTVVGNERIAPCGASTHEELDDIVC